jgi:hypothetical protein
MACAPLLQVSLIHSQKRTLGVQTLARNGSSHSNIDLLGPLVSAVLWRQEYLFVRAYMQEIQACFEGAGAWDPVRAKFTGEPDWHAIVALLGVRLVSLWPRVYKHGLLLAT